MGLSREELEQLRRSLLMSPSLPAPQAQRLLEECLRLEAKCDELLRRIDAAIATLERASRRPPP